MTKTARLWDATSGREIRRFQGQTDSVLAVAFSPDGRQVLTESADKTARLWEVATGKERRSFKGGSLLAFSPYGKRILTGNLVGPMRLCEMITGKEIRTFDGGCPAAFSPDGQNLVTASAGGLARLWDVNSGKAISEFPLRLMANSIAFSGDGKQVLTGNWYGPTRLWDCASGRELCQFLSFGDGTWAVLDPAGRYDSSDNGDIEWLHGVVGNDIIPLKQLKADRYDPGLLAKYMGFNKEPLRKILEAK
jgi:WD40 repeat protein